MLAFWGKKQVLTYFSRPLTLTSDSFFFFFKGQHHFGFRMISYILMRVGHYSLGGLRLDLIILLLELSKIKTVYIKCIKCNFIVKHLMGKALTTIFENYHSRWP